MSAQVADRALSRRLANGKELPQPLPGRDSARDADGSEDDTASAPI